MKSKKTVQRFKKLKIGFSKDIKEVKARDMAVVSLSHKKDSEVLVLPSGQKSVSVGMGRKKEISIRKLVMLCRKIISLAKKNKIKKLAINFSDFVLPQLKMSNNEIAEVIIVNFEMANFEFIKYKTSQSDEKNFVEEIIIAGIDGPGKKGINSGRVIGGWVNNCRSLANTPAGAMTPNILAQKAKETAKKTPVKVKVMGIKEIRKLQMGGVLGVASGSCEEPQFIELKYLPAGKEKPIVLVGKGVTFDSGGLNLKPASSMKGMHMDMSGAAAVISTIMMAAELKLKKNIIALVPAVENMPSGTSYRPGDILTTMSGKTVEVVNTDAEGRIILADALEYAKRYKPLLVVDVATLTGAAMVALGLRASAVFTRDNKLQDRVCELGERSGDYVWPLPLWDEYEEDIKGTFGDFANSGKTRYGGAITAAVFLHQFAKEYPWLHIDIAPRQVAVEGEYLAEGASGAPVRLLIKLLENI